MIMRRLARLSSLIGVGAHHLIAIACRELLVDPELGIDPLGMNWPVALIVKPAGTRVVPFAISCHDWIVSLMKRTEPSANAKLASPGWWLEADNTMSSTGPV